MNFFRSILSDEPDAPESENPRSSVTESPPEPSQEHGDGDDDDDDSSQSSEELSEDHNSEADAGGGWSFGGLMKNLSTRSESIIETYRRDLKEFGSGLHKETAIIREAASRVVKDLPASIEVAQGAIDGVLKSTAEIISHGKDTLLAPSDGESDAEAQNYSNQTSSTRRYSRFDSLLCSVQSDANTYCEDPEDLDDYNKWKLGFVLEEKNKEIESLIEENGNIYGICKRVVPNVVDEKDFWCRYFYRVHKLKQQEDVRTNLVKRAIAIDDEEELTWDVDDDETEEETKMALKGNAEEIASKELGSEELPRAMKESAPDEAPDESSHVADNRREKENKPNVETSFEELQYKDDQTYVVQNAETVPKPDEKAASEGKADNAESCKDSDVSVVSTQLSMPEEEDLGWDEIEDLGSNDEKKVTNDGASSRADSQKRLSVAEDDEDLSWDIEDDDEPVMKPGTN